MFGVPDGLFASKYGSFDAETGEFRITDVRTPRPWVNVLANRSYGLVTSQLGGGFSWFRNCQLYRLNRWEQDLVEDRYGRYLYLLDLDDASKLWSTAFRPTNVDAEFELVRHGLGYTVYEREAFGIRTELTVFVPKDAACEVWLLRVENLGGAPRRLRMAPYFEWQLGGPGDWHREFHRLFESVEAHGDTFFAWRRPGLREGSREPVDPPAVAGFRILGANRVEWCADKRSWLGTAGTVERPQGLFEPLLSRPTGRWDDPVLAGRFDVDLAKGETREFTFVLGADVTRQGCEQLLSGFTHDVAKQALEETKTHWRTVCRANQVQTDDEQLDLLVNHWLPYQTDAGRMTARCAYYQQGGAFGFRDQLQDSLMFLDCDPSRTIDQIKIQAEAMYEDGGVRHWWHPDSNIFAVSHHSDTCLWLSFATLEYLDETGDLDALSLNLRFLNRSTETYGATGTLLEHCLKGIDRALERRSPRGLPLIGGGDWNDGLSHAGIDGKGESVWVAMFLFHILKRLCPVLERCGKSSTALKLGAEAENLRVAVESHAWDGDRYIAGTSDDGAPFGSKDNEDGALFLNPQTWAVISGIGSEDRLRVCMETVKRELVRPYGALLLAPAFREVDNRIGYITRYAAGLRENGGVYSHAATWAIQAFSMLGDKETAYSIFGSLCPPNRSAEDPDRYAAEPYVMPGNIDGPDSPSEGQAGWTWYTGSAAWLRRMAIRWLLGVRPNEGKLLVDGSRPVGLERFTLRRPFRGGVLEIAVSKFYREQTLISAPEPGTTDRFEV